MLIVVDYGIGNLGSIVNMLNRIGAPVKISSSIEDVSAASKIILPGVGSYDSGMARIRELNLVEVLNHKVKIEKIPILGICLGMQLMTCSSEEGSFSGLSWIKAKVKKFDIENLKLRVPHMGWNDVFVKKTSSVLFKDMYQDSRFYFAHSYFVSCDEQTDVLTETAYGNVFASSIEHENIYGVQFHPEKSHKYGMKLLNNFWKI